MGKLAEKFKFRQTCLIPPGHFLGTYRWALTQNGEFTVGEIKSHRVTNFTNLVNDGGRVRMNGEISAWYWQKSR